MVALDLGFVVISGFRLGFEDGAEVPLRWLCVCMWEGKDRLGVRVGVYGDVDMVP